MNTSLHRPTRACVSARVCAHAHVHMDALHKYVTIRINKTSLKNIFVHLSAKLFDHS